MFARTLATVALTLTLATGGAVAASASPLSPTGGHTVNVLTYRCGHDSHGRPCAVMNYRITDDGDSQIVMLKVRDANGDVFRMFADSARNYLTAFTPRCTAHRVNACHTAGEFVIGHETGNYAPNNAHGIRIAYGDMSRDRTDTLGR